MRMLALLGACLIGLLCVPAAAAQEKRQPLAEQEEVASALRLLEAWLDTQVAYRQLPGMSIAVVHDQEVVWAKGFGFADVEKKVPATAGTIYRIASISKLFTAVAIM